MKLKLDENLPLQIASRLRVLGHDVHTTNDEGLSGCNDSELWMAAQREARTLITQDLDFSDARRFVPGSHHGIVLIRLGSPSLRRLTERIEAIFQYENVSVWPGALSLSRSTKCECAERQTNHSFVLLTAGTEGYIGRRIQI
jgi:predicted nuclease of predicted toxin-antitoxin system